MASLYTRNGTYYLKWYVGQRAKRISLRTSSLQIAKEKKRQLESALALGAENPLPTRTPIAEVLTRYVEHIRAVKTPKSAQTDIYDLREAFDPICDATPACGDGRENSHVGARVTTARTHRPPFTIVVAQETGIQQRKRAAAQSRRVVSGSLREMVLSQSVVEVSHAE